MRVFYLHVKDLHDLISKRKASAKTRLVYSEKGLVLYTSTKTFYNQRKAKPLPLPISIFVVPFWHYANAIIAQGKEL